MTQPVYCNALTLLRCVCRKCHFDSQLLLCSCFALLCSLLAMEKLFEKFNIKQCTIRLERCYKPKEELELPECRIIFTVGECEEIISRLKGSTINL